jgi:hypothetical protein
MLQKRHSRKEASKKKLWKRGFKKTLWKRCFKKDTLEKMPKKRHSRKEASKKTLWKEASKKTPWKRCSRKAISKSSKHLAQPINSPPHEPFIIPPAKKIFPSNSRTP